METLNIGVYCMSRSFKLVLLGCTDSDLCWKPIFVERARQLHSLLGQGWTGALMCANRIALINVELAVGLTAYMSLSIQNA